MNKMVYVDNGGDGSKNLYEFETIRNDMNDGKVVMRFYENDVGWTDLVRGKNAATLKDNGDGVTIKFWGGDKIKLDYSQLQELAMLLQYDNEDSGRHRFTSTITKLKPCECCGKV